MCRKLQEEVIDMKKVLTKHMTTILIVALLLVSVVLLVMIIMAPAKKAQATGGTPITAEATVD